MPPLGVLAPLQVHMLLDREQPESLCKRPLHLAYVDGWVDAVAQVHEDVALEDCEAPCEGIHLHLRAGSAIGVVVVRGALARGPVEVEVFVAVEPLGAEVDLVQVGRHHLCV